MDGLGLGRWARRAGARTFNSVDSKVAGKRDCAETAGLGEEAGEGRSWTRERGLRHVTICSE